MFRLYPLSWTAADRKLRSLQQTTSLWVCIGKRVHAVASDLVPLPPPRLSDRRNLHLHFFIIAILSVFAFGFKMKLEQ